MVKGKLKQRGYKRDVLQSYKMRIQVIKNRMERYNLIVLNNMTINFRTNIAEQCIVLCYKDVIFVFIVFYVDPASGMPYTINLCVCVYNFVFLRRSVTQIIALIGVSTNTGITKITGNTSEYRKNTDYSIYKESFPRSK